MTYSQGSRSADRHGGPPHRALAFAVMAAPNPKNMHPVGLDGGRTWRASQHHFTVELQANSKR